MEAPAYCGRLDSHARLTITAPFLVAFLELQGHASKSEGLLKTSGAAMLMSREKEMVALEDDLQAVRP
jgi:hypothetical protein